MADARKIIAGSERQAIATPSVGAPDPEQRVTVSLYLRRPSDGAPVRRTRDELRRDREISMAPALDRVAAFARAQGFGVVELHPGRAMLSVAGPLRLLEAAFGTRLALYEHPSGAFRARSGVLTAPAEIAEVLEAVLGLDQRPVATPKSIRLVGPAAAGAGYLPNEVTRAYGFPPSPGQGRGQGVAIIELGGGVADADTAAAFAAMGIAAPKVVPVLVSGGANAPGKDPSADGEVALDVQVAGAGAPGAHLIVYFAPNTDQGFVDAISQAAHDSTNRPSVMSISWGGPELGWTPQAITAMTSAFEDAAALGLSVFAASGDGLATDGQTDGRAHVDFPASSPWVVGCGGASLPSPGPPLDETVWNSDGGGTGGGVSDLFPPPAYQQAVKLPASVNADGRRGRGVPDVAADADPNTGYRVIVDGAEQVIGGTSAAAPLWAGLFALVNELAGKPVGQPHATLYAHPDAFNDVVQGDNRAGGLGYDARPGWDACTGLGTPKAVRVAALFRSAADG